MDIKTLQAFVTLGKDIATGLATLAAAYVGLVGLDTWKKQLTANAERELARRVLIAVYRVRDAINDCRFPPVTHDDLEATKKLHELQVAKLDEAQARLDAELLEAEAVW